MGPLCMIMLPAYLGSTKGLSIQPKTKGFSFGPLADILHENEAYAKEYATHFLALLSSKKPANDDMGPYA